MARNKLDDEARHFLRLTLGPDAVKRDDIYAEAKLAGMSCARINRVKRGIGVRITHPERGETCWILDKTPVNPKPSAQQVAQEKRDQRVQKFLHKILADGPMTAERAFERAKLAKITRGELIRAKTSMDIKVTRSRDREGWLWSLTC